MPFFPKLSLFEKALALLTVGVLAVTFANPPLALATQNAKYARTISLSATGSSDSKPDMASIETGIETLAVQARDALNKNNEVMLRMMQALKKAGLEERDIATTNFSIQPRYNNQYGSRRTETPQAPRIVGYTVRNTLHITVRNLVDLGRIVDRLVTLGSNRIGAISFGISDQDKARNEARKNAMVKVFEKAKLYAKAAGLELGPIISISENGGGSRPGPMAYRAKRSMVSMVPMAPGELKTSIGVNVTWALED